MIFFVEDAGAANYLAPVLEELVNTESRATLQVIATGKGAEILQSRGILFLPVDNSKMASDVFDESPCKLVVSGTSENPETLGLKLIDEAKRREITSIGIVDGPANANYRFAGGERLIPLNHAPDWLIVANDTTKKMYVDLGFCCDRIAVCGHPAYERALGFSRFPPATRARLRTKLYPNAPIDRPIALFVSETSDGLSPTAFSRSRDYTLFGFGTSDRRTDIVLEEVFNALNTLPQQPYFVLRLHPKNTQSEFSSYSSQIDQFSQGDDPLPCVYAADLIVGLTSILLDEAAVMGRPSLSVLPRSHERQWLFGIETGWVRCATNSQEVNVALSEMLAPEYVLPAIDLNGLRNASATAANFIRKRLEAGAALSSLD